MDARRLHRPCRPRPPAFRVGRTDERTPSRARLRCALPRLAATEAKARFTGEVFVARTGSAGASGWHGLSGLESSDRDRQAVLGLLARAIRPRIRTKSTMKVYNTQTKRFRGEIESFPRSCTRYNRTHTKKKGSLPRRIPEQEEEYRAASYRHTPGPGRSKWKARSVLIQCPGGHLSYCPASALPAAGSHERTAPDLPRTVPRSPAWWGRPAGGPHQRDGTQPATAGRRTSPVPCGRGGEG